MAEHEVGSMNTRVQEKTFEGFIKFTTRAVIACIVFLVFLALVGA